MRLNDALKVVFACLLTVAGLEVRPATAATVTIDWGAGQLDTTENPASFTSSAGAVIDLRSADEDFGISPSALLGQAALSASEGLSGSFDSGIPAHTYTQMLFSFIARTAAPSFYAVLDNNGRPQQYFEFTFSGDVNYVDAYSATGFTGFGFSTSNPEYGGGGFTVGTITLSDSDTPILTTGFTPQSASPIAEPSSLLMGVGLLALNVWRRRARS